MAALPVAGAPLAAPPVFPAPPYVTFDTGFYRGMSDIKKYEIWVRGTALYTRSKRGFQAVPTMDTFTGQTGIIFQPNEDHPCSELKAHKSFSKIKESFFLSWARYSLEIIKVWAIHSQEGMAWVAACQAAGAAAAVQAEILYVDPAAAELASLQAFVGRQRMVRHAWQYALEYVHPDWVEGNQWAQIPVFVGITRVQQDQILLLALCRHYINNHQSIREGHREGSWKQSGVRPRFFDRALDVHTIGLPLVPNNPFITGLSASNVRDKYDGITAERQALNNNGNLF
jgi:hypothetical protein